VISEEFKHDMAQFQILLNFLYERQVRLCFEKSVESLLQSFRTFLEFAGESIGKDL